MEYRQEKEEKILSGPAGSNGAGRSKRSAEIISALRACMLRKGYADTSITDVANDAGMSVSHLLYYYPSKDAMVLDLARELHSRVLGIVDTHRDEPAEERIHLLVDNMFIGVSREEMGLLRQLIALAHHNPLLQENVEEFAGVVAAYFESLFEDTPRQAGMSAADTAALAGALWVGLMINSGFQNHLDERGARRLFRKALLSLANFARREALAPQG